MFPVDMVDLASGNYRQLHIPDRYPQAKLITYIKFFLHEVDNHRQLMDEVCTCTRIHSKPYPSIYVNGYQYKLLDELSCPSSYTVLKPSQQSLTTELLVTQKFLRIMHIHVPGSICFLT